MSDRPDVAVADTQQAVALLRGVAAIGGGDCTDRQLRDRVQAAVAAKAAADAALLACLRQLCDRPEAVDGAGGDGARAARLLLVHGHRYSPQEAAREVAAAQALDPDTGPLPSLSAAYSAGEVTRAHVDAAVCGLRGLPGWVSRHVLADGTAAAAVIDRQLTEVATSGSPAGVRQVVATIRDWITPAPVDAASDQGARLREEWQRRGLWFRSVRGGIGEADQAEGRFRLDPVAGAQVQALIEHLARPAVSGTLTGTAVDSDGEPTVLADRRSAAQRRADALVVALGLTPQPPAALADATGAAVEVTDTTTTTLDPAGPDPAGPDPGADRGRVGRSRVEPTLLVLTSIGQLARLTGAPVVAAVGPRLPAAGEVSAGGEADLRADTTGAALDDATVANLGCLGVLRRVLQAPSGAVLDLGRAQRLATPAQRAAITVRDGGCLIPNCTVPVSRCEIHHDTPWSAGGTSDLRNLYAVCWIHHREVHAGIWQVEWHDGVPWVRPPASLDPDRRLRRNTTHTDLQRTAALARVLTLDHDQATVWQATAWRDTG